MWNLPNTLTALRVALIPVFVVVYYLPWEWHHIASAAIFTAAALTDWVDGYLARKMNLMTPFGAFLDPVADKLIVATALILLLEVHSEPWFALPVVIIIGREIVISALREWMAEIGSRGDVKVSMIGKVKTWVQMAAVVVLLVATPEHPWLLWLGYIAISAAAALTLWSMVLYLKLAWPQLKASS